MRESSRVLMHGHVEFDYGFKIADLSAPVRHRMALGKGKRVIPRPVSGSSLANLQRNSFVFARRKDSEQDASIKEVLLQLRKVSPGRFALERLLQGFHSRLRLLCSSGFKGRQSFSAHGAAQVGNSHRQQAGHLRLHRSALCRVAWKDRGN